MDCSLPDSLVHGILQARTLEWVAIFLLQGIFLTQEPNPDLHCWQILYQLSYDSYRFYNKMLYCACPSHNSVIYN